MSCEEMTMTEDLMELLTREVTDSQFEPPDAVRINTVSLCVTNRGFHECTF